MASLSSTHYLTSDDLDKIFQSTRKSVNCLSEFDDSSTKASTDSSFWESSEAETDSTATDDLSSEQSGSDPNEQLGSEPNEPSGENSHDSDQASESTFMTTQPYNLRLRKRAKLSEFSQVLSKVASTVMLVLLKVNGKEAKVTEEVGEDAGEEVEKDDARKVKLQERVSFKGQSR